MQKKPLLIGLGIAVVVILLVGGAVVAGISYFVSQAVAQQGMTGEAPVAVLRVEQGKATVSSSGVSQEVTTETKIIEGDEITVSDDGRAAIYWDGYGRTLIDAGTKLRVNAASRPAGEKSIKANLLIDIGRTWTRIEQVLDLGSEVSAATGDVVATVRGTSFGVERVGNASAIKVKESKVTATRPGSEEGVSVEEGNKLEIPQGSTGAFRATVALSASDLQDTLLLEGDKDIADGDYDLDGFVSGGEAWIQKAIGYLAWHPWLLAQMDFSNGGETFQQWYQGFPASVRADIEAQNGAPNYAEISRLLNW
ncbi:hypothetical protein IT087_00665 [Candidatus Uhrbacteria bacterium]|nr:hypothetical protein [Candidatus Uhrbacteria bacterium]